MSDGLLKQAVDAEKWDAAMKAATPINENMTLGEMIQYARFHEKRILLTVDPDCVNFSVYEYAVVNDGDD